MINSRLRVRSIATGVIAVLAAGGAAVPARAGLSTSANFTISGVLPVAKAQRFEVGPPGTASFYTPSMHDGRFTLSASAQGSDLGQIVTRTSFDCPADTPNPVLQILVTGPRSSADVTLHVQGTSKAPDGSPVEHNQTTSESTGIVSTLSETQLFKQCSE